MPLLLKKGFNMSAKCMSLLFLAKTELQRSWLAVMSELLLAMSGQCRLFPWHLPTTEDVLIPLGVHEAGHEVPLQLAVKPDL